VTALLVGWIALDQRPSPIDIVGMLAVLAGVALQEREEINVAEPEPS
jgi:drug/metabolite transporter (DMT)-like permease